MINVGFRNLSRFFIVDLFFHPFTIDLHTWNTQIIEMDAIILIFFNTNYYHAHDNKIFAHGRNSFNREAHVSHIFSHTSIFFQFSSFLRKLCIVFLYFN